MQKIFLKFSTLVVVCLLIQACVEEEIAPREDPQSATITSSESGRLNVNNSFSANIRMWSDEFLYATITLEGTTIGKKITINWGDGTVETYTFTEGYDGQATLNMEHHYATAEQFTITMTGDLTTVVSVIDPLNTVDILSINFDRLSNLENLHMPYNSLEILDVSKNRRLRRLYGPSSTLTKSIILPNTHELNFIASGSPNLPTEVVSAMISSVYKNAVRKKIYNGDFELASILAEDPAFPGPPTAEDMAKLIELRDVYGWRIFPNP